MLRPKKSDLTLTPVYGDEDLQFLYEMLRDRPAYACISHKQMPSFEDHIAFVASKPYREWMVIRKGGQRVGQIYLTHRNEIGIFLVDGKRARGIGSHAVRLFLAHLGPGRYLANISPRNPGSEKFFEKLGFRLCQHTYELEQ